VTGFVLRWGVRETFLRYLDALPDGAVGTTGGAVRDGQAFLLSGGRTSQTRFAFEGGLRFSGHQGVLDVALDGLEVRVEGPTGVLSTHVAGEPVDLADLGGVVVEPDGELSATSAVLTGDGAALLGGVYPPGTPVDVPVVHQLPA
jgi:hypothetical protein